MKTIVSTAIALAFLGVTAASFAADETAPASTPSTEMAKPAAKSKHHHHKHAAHKKSATAKTAMPKQ